MVIQTPNSINRLQGEVRLRMLYLNSLIKSTNKKKWNGKLLIITQTCIIRKGMKIVCLLSMSKEDITKIEVILCWKPDMEEVKKAVWGIGVDKAPGLDGFNTHFYRSKWDSIKNNLFEEIEWFMDKHHIARQTNHAFIILILKKDVPGNIRDYRLIACCSVLYKCISKLLTERLKLVLPNLISANRNAFIPGRHIADCSLLATEFLLEFNIKRSCPKPV